MAFNVYGSNETSSSNENKASVDFDAINKYVVETAQLEQPETLVGYVAAIIDLGLQEQPDAEMPFSGTAEDEEAAIADKPATYFKDGVDPVSKKPVRMKCWPQKPQQCVTLAIDFPEIIVDKGQFFGESKPLPLRLFLGGQFYIKESGMVVARPTPLKVGKDKIVKGKWSFDKKHLFHKMAVASKLIGSDDVFVPQDIDKLLGKAFQFQAQVFFKENGGKQYYTENIKFVGGLGRGQQAPELLTEPYVVMFDSKNKPEAVKELRAHIVNTMKRANNYATSGIKKQIEELRGVKPQDNEEKEEAKPIPAPKRQEAKLAPSKLVEQDGLDEDCPF